VGLPCAAGMPVKQSGYPTGEKKSSSDLTIFRCKEILKL
jgi:hypothetical protein